MYALNRSDAEDIISSRNERNTPISIGLMTGKNKLKDVLDNIAHNAHNAL